MTDHTMQDAEYPSRPETEDKSLVDTWQKAVRGDAKAQFMLGWAYEHGLGVTKSHDKCVRWYEISRDNGNRRALLALGNITWGARLGWFEQAMEVLTKHADEGDATAMYWLGEMYDSNAGCEQDPEKAMEMYTRCAETGSRMADGRIGIHYFEGDGVEQDVQKGLGMIERAGRSGNTEAMYYLGCSYRDGFNVDRNARKAESYLRRRARKKEPMACLALADMYSTEEYGMYSPRKASKWYLRGAELGGQGCMEKAARMYGEGWLVKRDAAKARLWRQRFLDKDTMIYGYERR